VIGPFLNLPNSLSLSRVPLSMLAGFLLLSHLRYASAAMALAAILTDWLDGFLARRTGSETAWGRVLDPLADKLGFAAFGTCLAITGRIPVWLLIALVSRDLLILGGASALIRRVDSPPGSNLAGKLSTAVMAAYMTRQVLVSTPSRGILLGLDWLGLAAAVFSLAGLVSYMPRLMHRRAVL